MLLFLCFSFNKVQAFSILGVEIEWHWPWEDGFLWGDDEDEKEENESSGSISIETAINNEGGGLFESTIGKALGGIAQAVFNIATSDELNLGFKDYDELIFNKQSVLNKVIDSKKYIGQTTTNEISPFDTNTWRKIMSWYLIFTGLASIPILIGTIVTSYKFITVGASIQKRNEAKDSFLRLFLGAVAIALAPIFVKLLLYINSMMVTSIVSATNGGLNKLLGNKIFGQIKTGSAIATALVICMFAYLFVKFNIKFIIRKFTLIVFIVFTPLISGMWIINKNVTGAAIWFGQIFINVFMQFIYAFLFLIYMSFTSVSDGWATSLLWAMMILPLGDVLLNTMQNLVSRIAGVNNEEISNRGIGMAAGMAYTIHSIGSQFISNRKEDKFNGNSINNSVMNDNTKNSNDTSSSITSKIIGEKSIVDTNEKKDNKRKVSLYGIGRSFLNAGMFMAEGRNLNNRFGNSEYRTNNKRYIQKNESIINIMQNENIEKSDIDEK